MPLKEQYPSKPATSLHLRKTTAYYTRTRVKSSKNCAFLSPNYMYITCGTVQYLEKSLIFLFKTKMKPQIFLLFQNFSVHHHFPFIIFCHVRHFAMSDIWTCQTFCHVRHFDMSDNLPCNKRSLRN